MKLVEAKLKELQVKQGAFEEKEETLAGRE